MERTYYTIIKTNNIPHDTDDIDEVRDAIRRGNDVLEVEEYVNKQPENVVTRLTITSYVHPNDFIF